MCEEALQERVVVYLDRLSQLLLPRRACPLGQATDAAELGEPAP